MHVMGMTQKIERAQCSPIVGDGAAAPRRKGAELGNAKASLLKVIPMTMLCAPILANPHIERMAPHAPIPPARTFFRGGH